ncbi:eukaryotic translation initiation factor 1A X-linked b [Lampris incognitus]|uniref:eukaryotic translation initiation factor 1A X-linked b n=1 Tax=Lampris incognitus TaxID=2546036 RepID=UPI0024B52512|nr:eukaryotic translation initiation factor 1A X-linked b [Lampris incognitus]
MPKNKGKGGKNRRRGKNENESEKRELVFKEDGQEYAQVIKMLGNGRLEAMCFDGVKRLCHIRGKLRKKVWINTSDIILVGLRDYQDNKADVILKYNADEARSLKAYGELPEHAKINETDTFGPGDDDEIQFDDIGDDDEDIDDFNFGRKLISTAQIMAAYLRRAAEMEAKHVAALACVTYASAVRAREKNCQT